MAALDTNVLVRLLLRDDAQQTEAAVRRLGAAAAAGSPLFVPVTVALELDWVLRSRYRYSREETAQVFVRLLETNDLHFESELAIEQALLLVRRDGADFADALHAATAYQAGQSPLLTFDKGAAQLKGLAEVLR